MFKRRFKLEVVPESEYTDFSEREAKSPYATKKTIIAATIPLAVAVPIVINRLSAAETYTTTTIPVMSTPPTPIVEPVFNAVSQSPSLLPTMVSTQPEMIQTGFVSDASMELLATALDPVIEILKVISLPIASIIMVGACFMFMFGNSERGWDMIMKAGLGYVLIQMSPMFLKILRQVGESVA